MGKEANKCYSWIAKKLVEKRDKPHLVVLDLKESILFNDEVVNMCTRGSQSINSFMTEAVII